MQAKLACPEYTPTKNNKHKSIRNHERFKDLFVMLDTKVTNCLYWFEVENNNSCDLLVKHLNEIRPILKEQFRVVPVINKNNNSNVLYVGIRRGGFTEKWGLSNISGRMIQHLGYYEKGSTQGLQLAHWSLNSDIKIKINIIQFEEKFPNYYLEAFEKIIAHKLRPLCGKH
ncbi:hypothetical protein [Flavobacterium kingsejongi]|uniref:Uncharacterized protein n=1 Tax=Flavobacterium kingsejongi TaxID=1678728 RepID=A0A2S1LSL3_9FLAO|nr:hypothetical protein [Flavobacterium kingsejongi]AWG26678.1 hypothetical protein FK004_16320 [Flavobacterium kingsejongi]